MVTAAKQAGRAWFEVLRLPPWLRKHRTETISQVSVCGAFVAQPNLNCLMIETQGSTL
jgi:hypothetical protein